MNSDKPAPTDRQFFGRRKFRPIREARGQALEEATAKFSLPAQVDLHQTFGDKKIWFEIGFGAGEHMAEQAARHPEIGFIGCEPFLNGVSSLAQELLAREIGNVRLWLEDALPLLQQFPDASLDRVFLLFPDPWPKTRHYKRRFIQQYTVALLARLLKRGGRLSMATDDGPLAEWMLLTTVQNENLQWDNAQDGDWSTTPADWVETRYQQKAAQQGRLAHFINFTKK
jgi:tRNA (guanine-N7-)-methyltransferase